MAKKPNFDTSFNFGASAPKARPRPKKPRPKGGKPAGAGGS
jgi:hypothetical protein